MLYHSAALSTGLGGITRLGFSRTSSIYGKEHYEKEFTKSGLKDFFQIRREKTLFEMYNIDFIMFLSFII